MTSNRAINILICEDNPGDVYIINSVLAKSSAKYNLNYVSNGEAALDYLYQAGEYEHELRPDLILLDLNLPQRHGFEVLKEIKTSPKFKTIPVIVLTSSKSEQDVAKSYELYCSCFVTKPFGFNEFTKAMKDIEQFWLRLVQLPPQLTSKN